MSPKEKQLVLVIASTFPAGDSDPVPTFVRDQIVALKQIMPDTRFSVLAPHSELSDTKSYARHEMYDEHRFHYFWPHSFEKLTGQGIIPSLKQNRFRYLLVPFFVLGEYFALRKLVISVRPSILYAHWFTPQAIAAALISKQFDIPFGFTTHASDAIILKNVPFGGHVVRQVSRMASFITAVSQRTTERLRYFFTDEEWEKELAHKFKVVPMGVALPDRPGRVDSSIAGFGLDAEKKILLFVGRLAEKKGVGYLIDAYIDLPAEIKVASQLIIMGDGPLLQTLHKRAEQEPSIVFTGFLHGAEKHALFQMADAVCIPSIVTEGGDSEGFPVVLMEGLQLGKIIIATDQSGAEEVIENGRNGFIVPQKSAQALKDTLAHVLSLNSSQIEELRRNSLSTGARYNWSVVAVDFRQILGDFLGAGSNSSGQ
jgi:glycosyltransferase involved in cell wall biosynthesis